MHVLLKYSSQKKEKFVMKTLIMSFVALICLLVLASCGTSPSSPAAGVPTPGTATTQPTSPVAQPTATPMPTSGLTQQYEFTDRDSGKTVTYTITSRFQIILNPQKYPQKQVRVACTPVGTLGSVTNLPSVAPPLYVVRYQGIQPGTCTIKNGSFLLTVIIVRSS